MKIKNEKLNILIPIAKDDIDFIDEFNTFKYLTKLGRETILGYSDRILKRFNKIYDIEIFFITTNKIERKYNLQKTINKFKFKKKLIIINNSKNIIDTLLKAEKYIKNVNQKILIFHPDSSNNFEIENFKKMVDTNVDGIQFSYNHFNPTDYMSSDTGRIKISKNSYVKKIFEKSPLIEKYHTCAGLHYFKNWNIFSFFARKIILKKSNKFMITSEIFNLMIKSKLLVKYLSVENFISFSNVSSVNEFNFWKNYFEKKVEKKKNKTLEMINVIPAAGSGKRHKQFKVAKPFIKISGKSMIGSALESLPKSKYNYVILRNNVSKIYSKELQSLKKFFSNNLKVININKKTDGMARTCLFIEKHIDKKLPLIISSCDYKIIYDQDKLDKLIKKENPESIIFTFREYPDARIDPNSYAYVKVKKNDNKIVTKVVEKKSISRNQNKDFAVTGAFYFKNWFFFKKAITDMIKNKNSVNGEYYVATSIQELITKRKKVLNFEIDKFISWSLPIHLKTYFFWEKIFNK